FAKGHLEQVVNQLHHIRVELLHSVRGVDVLALPSYISCFAIVAFHLRNKAMRHGVSQRIEALNALRHFIVERSNLLNESELPQNEKLFHNKVHEGKHFFVFPPPWKIPYRKEIGDYDDCEQFFNKYIVAAPWSRCR